jgi:hypothetical protein
LIWIVSYFGRSATASRVLAMPSSRKCRYDRVDSILCRLARDQSFGFPGDNAVPERADRGASGTHPDRFASCNRSNMSIQCDCCASGEVPRFAGLGSSLFFESASEMRHRPERGIALRPVSQEFACAGEAQCNDRRARRQHSRYRLGRILCVMSRGIQYR